MNYILLKELMKQSETECGFDDKKFAELIVRECINTVENLSPGYDDYRNQIEDAFRGDCVEQIKHHFGIE
jgi:hypothetical protein